ncbi:MAG: hypothetical protein RJA22_2672 [Verrucomicrobiota bacterium]
MGTRRLLAQNLALSFVAALIGALLGLVFSFAVGILAHREAMAFRYSSRATGVHTINTKQLEAFDRMQATALCLGAAAGILAAQSVFIVRHLRHTKDNDRDA